MIAPSINAERAKAAPEIWSRLSVEDLHGMIADDVAELSSLYQLQAVDAAEAELTGRQPDYRIRLLIAAWERTQDAHWSWLREIQDANANSGATQGS